jgi:spore germination protein GerM
LLVLGLFLLGLVARSVAVDGSNSFLVRWLPWMQRSPVTFYYGDADRPAVLVPVSRTMDRDTTIEDFLAEYLAGPSSGSGLMAVIPESVSVIDAMVDGTRLTVNLTGDRDITPLVRESLRLSLSSWKDAETVVVTIDGEGFGIAESTGHLLFFYDEARDMLVAEPTDLEAPRDVLAAYLAGPQQQGLIGLPADVELLSFEFDPSRELLRLDFTFTESVSEFALGHPEATRRVLEGLIATMTTEFPQFQGLYLDFEGHSALGLGGCADLLRNLQVTPETLNDERLLSRSTP